MGKTVRPKIMGARQKYPRMEERFVPLAQDYSHRRKFTAINERLKDPC